MSATEVQDQEQEEQPQEVDTTDRNLIWVKVNPKQGDKVGVWEVNDRHPKNPDLNDEREIYVAGQKQKPQQVARTAKVMTAIKDDAIMLVDAPKGAAKGEAKKPAPNTGTGAPPTGGGSSLTSNQNPAPASPSNPGNGEG